MADALPDDPVARAKAIALKLTATASPAPDDFAGNGTGNANGNAAVILNQAYTAQAPAPSSESELGKRKNRWGEDPQPGPSMPAGFGLPAALMAAATAGPPAARNKLFVPVKEHPEFNFMGVLIGPRGSSLKAMEQRTGAKILIRGRGSSKDPNSTDPEANEEMHVVIEGSDQAVAVATAEVEAIFKDPHRALIVKSEQLKNLATLNGGGGNLNGGSNDYGTSSNAYGPGATEDYQLEMHVPNKMVGLIIGRGGQNIQSMQRDYNITIQIASQSDVPPGSETRPVKLKGGRQSVDQARNQINQIISDRESELTGNGSGSGGGGIYGPRDGPQATNHLTIPDDKVGLVIGKGGGTIKGVQQRTGANIQIPPEADAHDRSKRTIVISAGSKDAADRAMAEVQNILSADAAAMGNPAGVPPGSQVLYCIIPDDKVGLVIGKGGSTIKELQNRTGCRIQIPPHTDPGSQPPTRSVTLTGVGDAPHNAKRDIEMMVADDERNRYGGGGPPQHQQGYGSGPPSGRYGGPPPPTYGAPPPQTQYYGAPPPQHHQQPYQPSPYGHAPPPQHQPAPYPYAAYQQPPPQQPQPAYGQPMPYQQAPQMAPAPAPADPQAPAPGQMPQPQQPPQQQPQQPQPQQQMQYYQQPQAPAPAQAPAPQPAAAPASAPGAVDMSQYHDQFWQYAAYYGEEVARQQYGAWAPPAGTPPPPGVNIPPPGQANPPPQS